MKKLCSDKRTRAELKKWTRTFKPRHLIYFLFDLANIWLGPKEGGIWL